MTDNFSHLMMASLSAFFNVAIVMALGIYTLRARRYPRLAFSGLMVFAASVGLIVFLFGLNWFWSRRYLVRSVVEFFLYTMVMGMWLIMLAWVLTMVDKGIVMMQNFHQNHNAQNLHRAPVRWVMQHPQRIQKVYQWAFALGSIPILYGIFFGMKF